LKSLKGNGKEGEKKGEGSTSKNVKCSSNCKWGVKISMALLYNFTSYGILSFLRKIEWGYEYEGNVLRLYLF